jgi:tRNA pseudouridine55 synthase
VVTETGRLPVEEPQLPTGEIRQRPPAYSAVKIGGERAYKRARRGEQFEMPERIVSVYRFKQLWRERDGRSDPSDASTTAPSGSEPALERAGYEIECSAGTYVRSLIADLHDAYCLELRRTAIGPFDVRNAVAPPRRGEPWLDPPLIPLQEALAAITRST